MNKPEAAHVLAVMAAPHPWDVDNDQADVWYQAALERCDYSVGLDVAVRLVETEERFPTPARFNKERSALERERWTAEQAAAQTVERAVVVQPGLPAAGLESPAEQRRKFFAEMRAMVQKQAANLERHDHRGPMPCPVCSGINPNVLAAMGPEDRVRVELAQQAHRDARKHLAPKWS